MSTSFEVPGTVSSGTQCAFAGVEIVKYSQSLWPVSSSEKFTVIMIVFYPAKNALTGKYRIDHAKLRTV
jgi:hypothetical protein